MQQKVGKVESVEKSLAPSLARFTKAKCRSIAAASRQHLTQCRGGFSLDRSTQGSHLSSFYHRARISILSLLDQAHRHRSRRAHRDRQQTSPGREQGSKKTSWLVCKCVPQCLRVESLLKSKWVSESCWENEVRVVRLEWMRVGARGTSHQHYHLPMRTSFFIRPIRGTTHIFSQTTKVKKKEECAKRKDD